ncbi:MAG TPA: ABC transporter permease [Vicinamibacterales bacterium]|nr:ABC transporter permease [Vicinamibacterales bacterium]
MRLAHIVRRLLQLPGFTTIAVLTLAIGIGANTAIFSVIEGVLLKRLPFSQPDQLVVLDQSAPGVGLPRTGGAPFLYFTFREDARVFQDVAMWRSDTESITGLAEPEEVPSLIVTDGLLPMLGVTPPLGRVFTRDEDSPKGPETVMLTDGYWRMRFGSDRSVIGRRLLVNGRPRDIIGVLPASFRFAGQQVSIVLPFRLDRGDVHLGNFSYSALARLKPGATIEQASAEVGRLIPVGIARFPPFPGFSAKMFEEAKLAPNLRLLKDDLIGDVSSVLWVLMGTIGMVLLIACANVANLLLVRAEGRQQELAVRSALGASRGRIAYELLAESVVLGVVGGVAGLALAYGAVRVLIALSPGNLPRLENIGIDATVLSFTLAISILAGLLFGAIPVFKYAGPHVAAGLRGGGRTSSASRERHRARSTLVVVQVALALVLLVSSGLMIRTFQALQRVYPGFAQPEQLLTFSLTIPTAQVKEPEAVVRMHQAIADRIATIPGVSSVALTTIIPMTDSGWHDPVFAFDKTYDQKQIPPLRTFKFVSPGLLRTMGQPLVAGRDFSWPDAYDRHPVAMVSEGLAREMWGQPPAALGKRIRENNTSDWREVIGVVGDVRDEGLDKKAPTTVYWPVLMSKFEDDGKDSISVRRSISYVIRSGRTRSAGFADEVGRAVWSINPNLPLANIRPLDAIVAKSMARTSFTLVMLAIAGAMALLLGAAGIYGVISYSVSQRTREIGIRMALGAQRPEVTRMFIRHGLGLTAIGIAFGLAAAFALARVMGSLLFEVSPIDPMTYVAVCAGLTVAALLASYLPALRATLVNPVTALRAE